MVDESLKAYLKTKIKDAALSKGLEEITKSVEEIENNAFYECSSLTDIYYAGTEEQWNSISISNSGLSSSVTIHYNS